MASAAHPAAAASGGGADPAHHGAYADRYAALSPAGTGGSPHAQPGTIPPACTGVVLPTARLIQNGLRAAPTAATAAVCDVTLGNTANVASHSAHASCDALKGAPGSAAA
jgi:hypothetical protein